MAGPPKSPEMLRFASWLQANAVVQSLRYGRASALDGHSAGGIKEMALPSSRVYWVKSPRGFTIQCGKFFGFENSIFTFQLSLIPYAGSLCWFPMLVPLF